MKYYIFFILVVTFVISFPQRAEAFVPDISVRVINSITGAPIPGVWVRQKGVGHGTNPGWAGFFNNCDGSESTEPISGRYMQTDINGSAFFEDPDNIPEAMCDQPVDTNGDGVLDVPSFPCTNGVKMSDPTQSCLAYGDFSCYGNPMQFEVVRPAGDTGTYTTISNLVMPNAAADMELTIYYTPDGSAPPPLPTPDPIRDTTKKEIGTLSVIGQKFQPLKQLEEGKDYWVRIQIFNNNRGYSRIALHEVVNPTYFQLYQPQYVNEDPNASTFFIESLKSHGYSEQMENTTNDECPSPGLGLLPSCISEYITNGNKFVATPQTNPDPALNTGPMNATSLRQKYISFKVRAIRSSNGLPVNVDVDDVYPAHTGSYVDFIDKPDEESNEPGLDNEQVVICPVGGCVSGSTGYFQVVGGDVYNNYTGLDLPIQVPLPVNTTFLSQGPVPKKPGILYQNDPDLGNFGAGAATETKWYLKRYTVKSKPSSYDEFYKLYKDKITVINNLNSHNQLNNGKGYYMDRDSISAVPSRVLIETGGWNGAITGKQATIFIPGDLYINSNIAVAADGLSSLIFIVKGNVGIGPTVSRIDGVILADGAIDTGCDSSIGFTGNSCASGSLSLSQQLRLSGTFAATRGFVLNRNSVAQPSELFESRPDFLLSALAPIGSNVYYWKEIIK